MKAFQVTFPGKQGSEPADAEHSFAGTQKEAHDFAKSRPKVEWTEITVNEVEVQADKEGILALLNHEPKLVSTGKSWALSVRGGLVEAPK
jgi:hypothetical protein